MSGRGKVGAQLLHNSFASSRLHWICNGSKNGTEDGGTRSSPTALGLGISAPPPPTNPKFPSLDWDWEGAQKCFILLDQTTGDLKSHHLQAWATLTAMSVPPRPPGGWGYSHFFCIRRLGPSICPSPQKK